MANSEKFEDFESLGRILEDDIKSEISKLEKSTQTPMLKLSGILIGQMWLIISLYRIRPNSDILLQSVEKIYQEHLTRLKEEEQDSESKAVLGGMEYVLNSLRRYRRISN